MQSGKAVHGGKLTTFKQTQSQPTFLDPITNSQGSMREGGKKKKKERNRTKIRKTENRKKINSHIHILRYHRGWQISEQIPFATVQRNAHL